MVRNRPKASARAVVVAVALSVAFFAGAEPVAKKFIGTGWDTLRVSPEEVLANASLFADSGLDGINLTFSTKNGSGEKLAFDSVFSSTEFKYDDLKHYVPVFQKIAAAPGLTETLLTVWWTPRPEQRLKWTDDAVYEAETAYLTDYSELDETSFGTPTSHLRQGRASWVPDARASGGVSVEKRAFFLQVDGCRPVKVEVGDTGGKFTSVAQEVVVSAGVHAVRLSNPWGPMPEIDKMVIE